MNLVVLNSGEVELGARVGQAGREPSEWYEGLGGSKKGVPVGLMGCLLVGRSPDCWKNIRTKWPLTSQKGRKFLKPFKRLGNK